MTEHGTSPTGTVVLIGGRAEREFEVLRDLGYRILYLDKRVPLQIMGWVDVPIDVDVDNWDAVASTVSAHLGTETPAAVLTHVEPRIPLMTHLAERLLPKPVGLTADAARNCRDKWRTRSVLEEAGLPVPRFGLAADTRDASRIARELGFPVVVKPRDGAGGFGVRRCESVEEVRSAAKAILEEASPEALPGVLVEEYLDGPEYAVQTLSQSGVTQVLSVLRQHMTEPPVFVELGYDYPSGLPDAEVEQLGAMVSSALAVLGIHDWISHTQVRKCADGFRIVEVNARRPGGRLVEMTEAVSGVDMIEAVTAIALGLPVGVREPFASRAKYRSVVFDQAGTLLYRVPSSVPATVPPIVEIEVPSGDTVHPVDHPEGGVYGRIVVFGDTAEELNSIESAVRTELDIQVIQVDELKLVGADSREFKSCC
ncbi:acetyl-CoA carboxylase biotin carboxylase subunit family protein [Lentzea sp. NPDC059081]|uniref:ATP-grasp domain-containing protein n=1 Tax=Lentzea sp. NPDC059081 TaxID=3346719 RepID=UPI00369E6517